MSCSSQGIAQTVRQPYELIMLLIGHFQGPTELQVNSWWKLNNLWLTNSLKQRTIFSKAQWIFFNVCFGNAFISKKKKWFWTGLLMMSCCTQETFPTVRWPCKPIIFSIRHFDDPTEVQLTVCEKLLVSNQWAVSKCGRNLSKPQWNFFECLNSKFIHFEKTLCKGASWWCHGEFWNLKNCLWKSP